MRCTLPHRTNCAILAWRARAYIDFDSKCDAVWGLVHQAKCISLAFFRRIQCLPVNELQIGACHIRQIVPPCLQTSCAVLASFQARAVFDCVYDAVWGLMNQTNCAMQYLTENVMQCGVCCIRQSVPA